MSYRDTLAQIARANSAEARARVAEERIEAVRQLHTPQFVVHDGYPNGMLRCAACNEADPCRTIRAINR